MRTWLRCSYLHGGAIQSDEINSIWQYGLIGATMTSSDGCMSFDILSTLSRLTYSMAHPSLSFSPPWLHVPYISSGQPQSSLPIIFASLKSFLSFYQGSCSQSPGNPYSCIPRCLVFHDPKSWAKSLRIYSLSSFICMHFFFSPKTPIPPLSSS